MRRMRLLWRLYPTYLGITLIALLAVTLHTTHALEQFHVAQVKAGLVSRAALLEGQFTRWIAVRDYEPLQHRCRELGERSGTRITVVLSSGQVIGDSQELPELMDNHLDREEIAEALAGRTGESIRFSHTVTEHMAYVAVPMVHQGKILGAIRTAIPLTSIQDELNKTYRRIAAGALVVALLAAVVAMLVARHISRPLEKIREGAERFAHGDLGHKLFGGDTQEIASLADTMNQMAAQLDDRISTAIRQRNELEAILSSMVEGVLAVDTEKRVLSMNESAAALFGVKSGKSQGRSLEETIRSPQLHQLVANVLTQQQSVADEFTLYTDREKYLHVQGAVLRDAQQRLIGALVVLYDVTQIKRLENVRRDFVANVSHELKTPITSIKGYVETLLDGAVHNPEDAERFLRIVANQSDRLNSIIDDLLELSRVEQKAERAEIPLVQGAIQPILKTAMDVSAPKAETCGVRIELTCDASLESKVNAPLLEQAVVNLIDNACKFSPPGGTVWVEAARIDEAIVIRVQDQGSGIEQHHLPRLFERFYRVDKSRSRKLGGTGLGLAIVKHIVQAHHGQVSVESTPNRGSTFFIYLPAA